MAVGSGPTAFGAFAAKSAVLLADLTSDDGVPDLYVEQALKASEAQV
ncbi:hypothetical protein GCM10011499_19910 [Pelagibacterium lentulum]|uniref:Uncharacterized protein n=1 Tax=Pelagibacterium lentulum TaxID=2029865 RepID=A0A916REI7_9HYPH|nr:hypothetical protein GCM10011499_19910 [Pelagibacterium lentulum]